MMIAAQKKEMIVISRKKMKPEAEYFFLNFTGSKKVKGPSFLTALCTY